MSFIKNTWSGFFAICFAMAFSSSIAMADNHSKDKKSGAVVQKIEVYKFEERNDALVKAEQMLNKLDRRIDALQTRIDNNWDTLSRQAQKKARATMKDLQQQRIAVAEWYGGLKNSSEDAWEEVKAGFLNAYEALEAEWEDAKSEF